MHERIVRMIFCSFRNTVDFGLRRCSSFTPSFFLCRTLVEAFAAHEWLSSQTKVTLHPSSVFSSVAPTTLVFLDRVCIPLGHSCSSPSMFLTIILALEHTRRSTLSQARGHPVSYTLPGHVGPTHRAVQHKPTLWRYCYLFAVLLVRSMVGASREVGTDRSLLVAISSSSIWSRICLTCNIKCGMIP